MNNYNVKCDDGIIINEAGEILEATDEGSFKIAEYNPLEACLLELEKHFSGDVPDANTEEGYEVLKQGVKDMGKVKKAIEGVRKHIKQPALDRSRAIDGEANGIKARIDKFLEPWKAAKKEKDDEAKRIEDARISAIHTKIDAMRNRPIELIDAEPEVIQIAIDSLNGDKCEGHEYREFSMDALKVRDAAVVQLEKILVDRVELAEAQEKAAELERVSSITTRIQRIKDARIVGRRDNAEVIKGRIQNLIELDTKDGFEEFADEAEIARRDSIGELEAELVEVEKEEASAAELLRLQALEAESTEDLAVMTTGQEIELSSDLPTDTMTRFRVFVSFDIYAEDKDLAAEHTVEKLSGHKHILIESVEEIGE